MKRPFLFLLYSIIGLATVFGRPLVRNLRTHDEFNRLLKYHAEETGLPVIIDFFSEGCGPCRMIAPHYKRLAKEYKDRAVFAKVDVNLNRETSSRQSIRSMPTFQFYLDKKKQHQFSGADIGQVRHNVEQLIQKAEQNNIRITKEHLMQFYEKHAPDKATPEQIEKVLAKAGGEGGGAGHRKLAEALRKKYGKPPKLVRREKKESSDTKKAKSVDLSSFSMEQLAEEIRKRSEKDPEAVRDIFDCPGVTSEEEDDENELDEHFPEWVPSGYTERLVIVGAGPAGLTAAIYAGRAGLRPVVIAPPEGGQLQAKGVTVENYPGVPDSTGFYVVNEMMKQAAEFGTTFAYGTVTEVDFNFGENKKKLVFEMNNTKTEIFAQGVIIATGANARWLEVPGEEEYKGKGISACATCDGYMFQNKEVVVIGGGDSAMEEALHLSKLSSKVTLLHRGDSFRASHILRQRVFEQENIVTQFNTVVTEFKGEEIDSQDLLRKLKVKVNKTVEEEIEADGAFIAIGHIPNTWFLKDQLDILDSGYIQVKGETTETSIEGVFACGDVVDAHYRQAVTAGGTGAMAALDAERWFSLTGLKDEKEVAEAELMAELMTEFGVKGEEEC